MNTERLLNNLTSLNDTRCHQQATNHANLSPFRPDSYVDFFIESFYYFDRNIRYALNDTDERRQPLTTSIQSYIAVLWAQTTLFDWVTVTALSILFTWARSFSTTHIIKPFAKWQGVKQDEIEKIPESAWKMCFYLFTWTSSFVYMFTMPQSQNYFTNPESVWQSKSTLDLSSQDSETCFFRPDYSLSNSVEPFIYWIYLIELSFYLHSLYTTAMVDQRRKDTNTMLLHHIICILLIVISYGNKSHKSGLLTLFLHDGCDVVLETTKLIRYFKVQHGKMNKNNDLYVNIGFALFLMAW